MAAVDPKFEAVAWLDGAHVPLATDLFHRMDQVSLLAVGGPARGDVSAMAQDFDVPVLDDFRQLRIEHPSSFLLLGTVEGATSDDLGQVLAAQTDVLALEPVASRIDAVPQGAAPGDGPAAGRLVQMPLMRCAPGWLRATDPRMAMGELLSGSIDAVGPGEVISLFAHLADAMELAIGLFGTPDIIDAQLVGPLTTPPADLHGLTGSITAHLRFGEHAGVTLHVSDQAPAWHRAAVLLGKDGMIRFNDQQYTLTTHEAGTLDASAEAGESAVLSDLLAYQWRWLIDQSHSVRMVDRRVVIGCCQTVLLSTRTGQSESPQTLLKMTHDRAI
jgi:hypothetical protein